MDYALRRSLAGVGGGGGRSWLLRGREIGWRMRDWLEDEGRKIVKECEVELEFQGS